MGRKVEFYNAASSEVGILMGRRRMSLRRFRRVVLMRSEGDGFLGGGELSGGLWFVCLFGDLIQS